MLISDLWTLCLVRWRSSAHGNHLKTITLLRAVIREIRRLCQHPDLFPNQKHHELFCRAIALARPYIETILKLEYKLEETTSNWLAACEHEMSSEYRQTYQESRLPWLQFLHSEAPGFPTTPECIPENCIRYQIVPPGGGRLLEEWGREQSQIRREVKEVYTNTFIKLAFSS